MTNIFVYGTLKDQGFVERMLGHSVEMRTGFLDDYVRLEPNFYMIFPHKGFSVKGLIISNLSDEDVARFDRYEGNGFGYYDRQPVTVRILDYEIHTLECEAYVAGPNMSWFYKAWLEGKENPHN